MEPQASGAGSFCLQAVERDTFWWGTNMASSFLVGCGSRGAFKVTDRVACLGAPFHWFMLMSVVYPCHVPKLAPKRQPSGLRERSHLPNLRVCSALLILAHFVFVRPGSFPDLAVLLRLHCPLGSLHFRVGALHDRQSYKGNSR